MKILPFSGILSEVRSIVEITKGVQSKILDHKFLKLWTYQPRPPHPHPHPPTPTHPQPTPPHPHPPSSLSLHEGAHTQALFTQCSPVDCIVFSLFYSFRCSLISIHSVKKNSTRTAVGVILNTLWWNAPMSYHLWCHWWGFLQTTPCFPVIAQPDWFMCFPLGQRKTFL